MTQYRTIRVDLEIGPGREFMAGQMTLDVISEIENLAQHGLIVRAREIDPFKQEQP